MVIFVPSGKLSTGKEIDVRGSERKAHLQEALLLLPRLFPVPLGSLVIPLCSEGLTPIFCALQKLVSVAEI